MNKPRSKLVGLILRWGRVLLVIALLYAVAKAIGLDIVTGFFIFMFGPWLNLFDKHGVSLGTLLTHPITLIIGAIIVFDTISNMRKRG